MSKKIFKLLFLSFLIVFIITYVIEKSGYYEYKLQERTILTEESIKQFEEDVKNDKNIDIEDYVVNTKTDYSNKFTNSTIKISDKINKSFKKSIELVFNAIYNIIEE